MQITPFVAPTAPCRRPNRALTRERARLRAHFRVVLRELLGRDVSHLDAAPRAMRVQLIETLRRYARAGRFPRNLDFPTRRMPYFVDAFGTRCAMAHLIEATGGAALVATVATSMNNARVHDLASHAALRDWLERAGLTVDEAARIQPSYCFLSKAEDCFCSSVLIHSQGVVEATVLTKVAAQSVSVRVDAVYGSTPGFSVGQEQTIGSTAVVNDKILLELKSDAQGMPVKGNIHKVLEDGNMEPTCLLDVPPLGKLDAIAAMLNQPMSMSPASACKEHLIKLDSRWGESICESQARGCTVGSNVGGSPLFFGTALALAAVWSRRRRSRSRRPGR